jgi:hypothetical protein
MNNNNNNIQIVKKKLQNLIMPSLYSNDIITYKCLRRFSFFQTKSYFNISDANPNVCAFDKNRLMSVATNKSF